MRTSQETSQSTDILTGWKSIAAHMGMGVRTVQRYEQQLGLPVRRLAGRSRGAVLATKSELDAWIAASPIRESFQLAKLHRANSPQDMVAIKLGIAEMRTLRAQMTALRSEVHDSMRLLSDSIQTLRSDLWSCSFAPPHFSGLDSDPQTRRLLAWMSKENKNQKAS